MAEEPKAWMKENELLLVRTRQNAERITLQAERIRQIAIILRDIVYLERLDNELGEKDVLADHQAILDEIIAGDEDES